MSEHDCLNNEDQLDSVLDEVAQIDSEFDSVDDIDSDLEKVVEVAGGSSIKSIYRNDEEIAPDDKGAVRIQVADATSQLLNDGDGTSPFATEEFVKNNSGGIKSISVDGINQPIDENKNVDITGVATKDFVSGEIEKLVGLAPETLDSFEEIAKELGDSKSAVESLASSIGDIKAKNEEQDSAIASKLDASALENYVDLTSEQRISGVKIFNDRFRFLGNQFQISSSANADTFETFVYRYQNRWGVGTRFVELSFSGSNSRPTYINGNSERFDFAFLSDIPTIDIASNEEIDALFV